MRYTGLFYKDNNFSLNYYHKAQIKKPTSIRTTAFLSFRSGRTLSGLLDATLFDAGLLAGEGAEVVELRTAHFTVLVDSDALDEG